MGAEPPCTVPGWLQTAPCKACRCLHDPGAGRRTSSSPCLGCQHTLGPRCTHEASRRATRQQTDASGRAAQVAQAATAATASTHHCKTPGDRRYQESLQTYKQPTCSTQLYTAPADLNSGDRIATQTRLWNRHACPYCPHMHTHRISNYIHIRSISLDSRVDRRTDKWMDR